jgi:hypothetical protein
MAVSQPTRRLKRLLIEHAEALRARGLPAPSTRLAELIRRLKKAVALRETSTGRRTTSRER